MIDLCKCVAVWIGFQVFLQKWPKEKILYPTFKIEIKWVMKNIQNTIMWQAYCWLHIYYSYVKQCFDQLCENNAENIA